ncbi:uncharacterized protein LOC132713807 [Ruditapes philippinarum]|uniref:uncharacterized protein LOC132713807 n=1 Tax=Ruditapes philippinarum TaxID=129788 RepID=UPI00295AD1D8|nr:uncharacterized protein LOC132713807 [Ruditapes philippinarum]
MAGTNFLRTIKVLTWIYLECNAAISPLDEAYTASVGSDFTIPWTYDNEADMYFVTWTFKPLLLATPTTIMSTFGTSAAVKNNNFNVQHVSNGKIKLKSVTIENAGIYYCTVDYFLASGLPSWTGTATISVTASMSHEGGI